MTSLMKPLVPTLQCYNEQPLIRSIIHILIILFFSANHKISSVDSITFSGNDLRLLQTNADSTKLSRTHGLPLHL